jgi:benzoylformate decarboxylase
MLLKLNIMQYWQDQVGVPVRDFPHSFDLNHPVINFATLAQSMGVPGLCVDHPDMIESAVKEMLSHDGPFLIDMVIGNSLPG